MVKQVSEKLWIISPREALPQHADASEGPHRTDARVTSLVPAFQPRTDLLLRSESCPQKDMLES